RQDMTSKDNPGNEIGSEQRARLDVADKDDDEDSGVDWLGAYLYWLRQRAGQDGRVDWGAYDRAAQARDAMAPAPRERFGPAAAKPGAIGVQNVTAQWEYIGPNNYSSYNGPNTG